MYLSINHLLILLFELMFAYFIVVGKPWTGGNSRCSVYCCISIYNSTWPWGESCHPEKHIWLIRNGPNDYNAWTATHCCGKCINFMQKNIYLYIKGGWRVGGSTMSWHL
jgi:hypothetical protein